MKMKTLALLFFSTVSSTAAAQSLTDHGTFLVEPTPGTFYEKGVGAPTVAYDASQDQWVMYFETKLYPSNGFTGVTPEGQAYLDSLYPGGSGPDLATCVPGPGFWGIGRATSPDGLNWTVDADPVVLPEGGSAYGCFAAHPEVLFDGSTWHLWFKGGQGSNACANGTTPAWGCTNTTGVQYQSSSDGINFSGADAPAIVTNNVGFPNVMQLDGSFELSILRFSAASNAYELFSYESAQPDGGFTALGVMGEVGAAGSYSEGDLDAGPTLCGASGSRFLEAWVQAEDINGQVGVGTLQGSGNVLWDWATTTSSYLFANTTNGPDSPWRHHNAVRVGEEALLYYGQKDANGAVRIGLAYTYPSVQSGFNTALVGNNVCATPVPPDTGDTDDTAESDPPGETDIETGDTDEPPVETGDTNDEPDLDDGGCDCSTSPSGPGGALLLLPLIGAVFRRRQ